MITERTERKIFGEKVLTLVILITKTHKKTESD